jgi:hypothetical protein
MMICVKEGEKGVSCEGEEKKNLIFGKRMKWRNEDILVLCCIYTPI